MEEYDSDMDQMLFFLTPLAGSSFKKIYYDTNFWVEPLSKFIPVEDLDRTLSLQTDLDDCP